MRSDVLGNPCGLLHLREFRKPNCQLRAKLPGVKERIDDILAGAAVCDPAEVVKAAFSDHLDQATFRAIEERFPKHQRDCTSDKKMINVVMNEICHIDIWKYDMKSRQWGVYADKLREMANLFASVRSDSRAFDEQPHAEVLPFLPEMNGDEHASIYGDES